MRFYPARALAVHAVLFILVLLAFVWPVIFGQSALLPVPFSGVLSILVALALLGDASYKAFAPTQRPSRGLRLLSAIAAVALLVGWAVWLYIYGNFDSAGTVAYRVGTFCLSVGAVLNLFCVAISTLDLLNRPPRA
ncbi:multidrug transporter [Corynebacterium sp.]|uniref:multidrug transporter n=1 Tax=Corynebacterium sp. TaxID=1720 RepID=UPI0026DB0FD6|nr:multidrug transporter [Corynebacterium sp.]MDO5032345.1 multidrug transporter [Corynebacterium sp.]